MGYNPKKEKSSNGCAPPRTHSGLGVFKSNDYKYYSYGVLVNQLADPDNWKKSVLTCTLHAIKSNQFLMHFNQIAMFSSIITYSSACNNHPNFLSSLVVWLFHHWPTIQVQTMVTFFKIKPCIRRNRQKHHRERRNAVLKKGNLTFVQTWLQSSVKI